MNEEKGWLGTIVLVIVLVIIGGILGILADIYDYVYLTRAGNM
jgi:ABC-type phosphate transport system permease subunit